MSFRGGRFSVRAIASAVLAITVLSGCSSTTPPAPPSAGAIDQWQQAYNFLARQTKPAQIVCLWLDGVSGKEVPLARAAAFYNFSDTSEYLHGIVTRDDSLPRRAFKLCEANVPTTVPYGPAIETFLRKYKLTFVAHPLKDPGLTRIEIIYAGENANDPDIIYRHLPGLFALRWALTQLGNAPFVGETSKIVQPTDQATAERYLQYAKPLLAWYGYQG